MNILYIAYDYPPKVGGSAAASFHIVRELRKYNRVTVVTSRELSPIDDNTACLLHKRLKIFAGFKNAVIIKKKIKEKFDIVISGESSLSGVTAAIYKLLSGCKFVTLLQGLDFYSLCLEKRNFYVKPLFSKVDLGIANSKNTKDLAMRLRFVKRAEVITPGIDLVRFHPRKIREDIMAEYKDRRIILTVSRLVERKGIDYVLKALGEVDEDFLYLVVGNGPEQSRLQELASSLGLKDKVVFLGHLPEEELVEYYNLCHFFILTPYEIPDKGDIEGFGMVYLEANACGRPVIATRSGGVPDAVKDKISGILVKPQDVVDIRETIKKMLTDEVLYNQLSSKARKWAERFDWNRIGERYNQTLNNLLDNA